MRSKRIISHVLAVALVITSFAGLSAGSVKAAAAPKLNPAKKTVNVGDTFTIKVKKAKGVKTLKKATWKSSKAKVAAVKAKGKLAAKVTAKGEGTAKITATVKYVLSNNKNAKKKLTCKVKVNAAKAADNTTPAANNQPANNQGQAQNQATQAPKAEPTPEPTQCPYYNDKGYYAGFNGAKTSKGTDNIWVNYVMCDSKEVNTKASAVNSIKFKIDTNSAIDIDVYVAEWDCSAKAAGDDAKVGSFKTDGTVGQEVTVNLSGSALSSLPNEKISFGFLCKCDKEQQFFCLHDMYVGYGGTFYPATLTEKGVGCTSYTKGVLNTRGKDASEITSDKYTSLCQLTEDKGYKFGTVVNYDLITGDKVFCDLVKKHCDSITAANEFKAYSLLDQGACKSSEDGMPRMNYSQADTICEWAKENNLVIRGHCLVWDQSMKQWFFNEGYEDDGARVSQSVARARLQSYIDQVLRHFYEKYPDVIYCWDVVNEGIDENGSDPDKIRQSRDGEANPFYEVVGNDYIQFSFKCARDTMDDLGVSADKVALVYNDFNVIYSNKRTPIINLVKKINSYDGNRKLCDTIGMQGYLGYGRQANMLGNDLINNVISAIQEISRNGLKVQLTEMAMRNFTNTEKYMNDHATFSKNLFTILADINTTTNGAFTSMSLWAFIDNPIQNYTDDNYEYDIYTPYSGLFDDVYSAKDSFFEVYKALGGEMP